MIRQLCGLAVIALLLVPGDADAQRRFRDRDYGGSYNAWSLEPYAGAYRDAYDISGSQTGYVVGLRVGYTLGPRWTLLGNIGYNETEDVAFSPLPDQPSYDNEWVLTTAGVDFTVIPGRTSAALGAQAGVGWRRVNLDDDGPQPLPGQSLASDNFASYDVVVPALTLRHRLTTRAALTARFEDYMFDVLEGPVNHSLALTLGVSFR